MKLLGWIALIALVLLTLFAAANWTLVTAPAHLNLLVLTVQGPLGLILLGATLVLVALFAVYTLSLRTSALVETRRHLKELEAQRQLADKAESSRFTALATQLEQQFTDTRGLIEQVRADSVRRADDLEQSLLKSLSETANALFAHVGQIDDKLNRMATNTRA